MRFDFDKPKSRTVKQKHGVSLNEAAVLYKAAFDFERQAARALTEKLDAEPTRSILHRSAATLALDCGQHREAEVLICEALRGTPPPGIADELRDLLEQVYFRRHLDLRGVTLSETEVQMSIAGKAVGYGIAPVGAFVPRINDAERLMYRTAERLSNLPFRTNGRVTSAILNTVELFSTVPRAASFAVSFRVGHSTQLRLDGIRSLGEETIDDLFECLELFNKGDQDQLKQRIPQEEYFNNFVALARNIGPDGEDVNMVGFTATRRGVQRTVALTGEAAEASAFASDLATAALNAPADPDRDAKLRGFLKEADSRDSKQGRIHVVDAEGTSHRVVVPPGMMTDIVKPLWESWVEIIGTRKRSAIHLTSIRQVKTQTEA
jgi:hypothetical protein